MRLGFNHRLHDNYAEGSARDLSSAAVREAPLISPDAEGSIRTRLIAAIAVYPSELLNHEN